MFDDRMEVRSPGSLVSTITVEQLKKLTGAHQSRNAYTARVLRELGYMRELGEGIPRMFRAMTERDLVPPEIISESATFAIVLSNRSVFPARDQEWLEMYKPFQLSRDEQRVLLLGRDGRLISPNQIMQTLNIVDTEDYSQLNLSMQRKGLLYSALTKAQVAGGRRRAGGSRRDVPRFAVRSADQLEQFLQELAKALRHVGEVPVLTPQHLQNILKQLSASNPYGGTPMQLAQSLTYLGFADSQRRPLPRLRALWEAKA